jgi:hypothetical protein
MYRQKVLISANKQAGGTVSKTNALGQSHWFGMWGNVRDIRTTTNHFMKAVTHGIHYNCNFFLSWECAQFTIML